MTAQTKKLHRVPEAAIELNMAPKTLRNWIDQGRIGIVRLGARAIRIPQTEIDRIIDEGIQPARRTA